MRERSTTFVPRSSVTPAGPRFEENFPMTRIAATLLVLLMVGGCTDTQVQKGEPSFYRNLAQPGAELDAASAASMISGYRANNGLPTVALDPELMQLAQTQAERMA